MIELDEDDIAIAESRRKFEERKAKRELEERGQKGGQHAKPVRKENHDIGTWKLMSVRMRKEMLQSLENALRERPWMSRNDWIMEAIHEKLKRG